MSSTRSFLFAALAIVGFLLWQAWEQDYGPQAPAVAETPAASADIGKPAVPTSDVPQAPAGTPQTAAPSQESAPATPAPAAALVDVRTDLLHLKIDTLGAAIVEAELLAYPQDPHDKTRPVKLLDDAPATYFVAQSGLVSGTGAAPDHRAPFAAEKTSYELAAGADSVEVPFTWQDASGLKVRKVYIFKRGSYLVDCRVDIDNAGTAAWSGNEYRQLQRVPPIIPDKGFSFNNPEKYAFAGAAWYSPQDKFEKLPFDKFSGSPLTREVAGGWVAMLQHYFFAAWIPAAAETDAFSTTLVPNTTPQRYLIRAMSPAIAVAPGQTRTLESHLYVGPTLQSQTEQIEQANIAHGLYLTADYGKLTFIAEPLHWILVKLHGFVGNWGLAIILLVLIIKLAMFKLSESQFRSMAKMRRLQPRMEALK